VRTKFFTFAVAFALARGIAAPLCAQSLATVAKKEEDRRKTIKDPAKVYTNKDLGPVPAGSPPAAETGATDAKEPDKDAAAKDAGSKDKDNSAGAKDSDQARDKDKGQSYWREKMKALQTQADRDQTYLDAVQTRVNSLTTDFVNRDDPAQKSTIERERQRNLGELERLKKTLLDDKKAIADLEDEARRAGVPPGWLR
jgi:hypothetical protein